MTVGDSAPSSMSGPDRLLIGSAILFVTVAALFASYDYFSLGGESGEIQRRARYDLGDVYMMRQNPEAAITQLNEVLATDPSNAYAWYLLGVINRDAGNVDGAVTALRRAVLEVPNYAEAYGELTLAYDEMGLRAESAYARGMRAYSQLRYDDAIRELEAARRMSPRLTGVYIGLGLVWEARSQPDRAAEAYAQALQLEPDNQDARAGLVRLGELSEVESSETRNGP